MAIMGRGSSAVESRTRGRGGRGSNPPAGGGRAGSSPPAGGGRGGSNPPAGVG